MIKQRFLTLMRTDARECSFCFSSCFFDDLKENNAPPWGATSLDNKPLTGAVFQSTLLRRERPDGLHKFKA